MESDTTTVQNSSSPPVLQGTPAVTTSFAVGLSFFLDADLIGVSSLDQESGFQKRSSLRGSPATPGLDMIKVSALSPGENLYNDPPYSYLDFSREYQTTFSQ